MSKFKVGDRARVVGREFNGNAVYIGRECTIRDVGEFIGAFTGLVYRYEIDIDGADTSRYANEDELEPINKEGLSSWEEFERATGFNPAKQLESV